MSVDQRLALERLVVKPTAAYGRIDRLRQTEPERVLQLVWDVWKEVGKGAFAEYFSGVNGANVDEAVAALRTIGSLEAAECLERAYRLVDKSPTNVATLPAETSAALAEYDDQFPLVSPSICPRLYEYVINNRDSIRGAHDLETLGDVELLRRRQAGRYSLFTLMASIAALAACFAFSCAAIVVILFTGPLMLAISKRPVFWMAFTVAAWLSLITVVKVAPPPIQLMPSPGTEPGHQERETQLQKELAEQARWAMPVYSTGLLTVSVLAGWAAQSLASLPQRRDSA
jgi:hypothetical protein